MYEIVAWETKEIFIFHVIEWMYTGFGLVTGFMEILQIRDYKYLRQRH
jgi:hypothetical protein